MLVEASVRIVVGIEAIVQADIRGRLGNLQELVSHGCMYRESKSWYEKDFD